MRVRKAEILNVQPGVNSAQLAVTGPGEADTCMHLLDQPFAVIGRARDCDIRLDDDEVSYRHAYLQRIGGRILCTDLCSRTGVLWNNQRLAGNWLSSDRAAQIGPYRLQIVEEPAGEEEGELLPVEFDPLTEHTVQNVTLPQVHLEALEGDFPAPRWPIDRMLTLIGRSKGCTLRLKSDSLSSVHTSLLLTSEGLFAVDLLGRGGTIVDGANVRHARLSDGTILEIGNFRMRVRIVAEQTSESIAETRVSQTDETTTVAGTEYHRVFRLEERGNILLVSILGDATRFHYADVHKESNAARRLIQEPRYSHVIIEFSSGDVFSSVSIAAVVAIARTATNKGGRAILCNVTGRTAFVLASMHITDVWPAVPTRDDAFAAINS